MAKREGQGLQIAVIIFAMLTIILAITTYIFYAQSQTAQKDLDTKTKALNEKQSQYDKLMYRVQAMNYVMGLKGVTMQEVDLAKSKAGDDADVKEILDNFEKDVALVGEKDAAEAAAKARVDAAVAASDKAVADYKTEIDTIGTARAQSDEDRKKLADQ